MKRYGVETKVAGEIGRNVGTKNSEERAASQKLSSVRGQSSQCVIVRRDMFVQAEIVDESYASVHETL